MSASTVAFDLPYDYTAWVGGSTAREAIDLAVAGAAAARADAVAARRDVAATRWEHERAQLEGKVPAALLDLCEPYLKDGQARVIDLSEGETFDVGRTLLKILDEAKGFVDLSHVPRDQAQADEAKRLAGDAWDRSI